MPRNVAAWIARAAALAHADPAEVSKAFAARRKHEIPEHWTREVMLAVDWLEMSETRLEHGVERDINVANALRGARPGQSAALLYYHTYRSDRSRPGFPDDALLDTDNHTLYLWENKRENGVMSRPQLEWLTGLLQVERLVVAGESGVMRPSLWYGSERTRILGLPTMS